MFLASLDVETSDRFASSQIRHSAAEGRHAAQLRADGRKEDLFIFFKEVRITIAQAIRAIDPNVQSKSTNKTQNET